MKSNHDSKLPVLQQSLEKAIRTGCTIAPFLFLIRMNFLERKSNAKKTDQLLSKHLQKDLLMTKPSQF